MQPLETDILEFIHDRFEAAVHPSVLDLLAAPVLGTPRVQRAVLYLSDGSLSMLKHYAECARHDVSQVLERAEYVLGIPELALRIRDCRAPMSSTYPPQDRPAEPSPEVSDRAATGRRGTDPTRCNRHQPGRPRINLEDLRGARFRLGDAHYVVLDEPGPRLLVRCARRCDNVISIMRLPVIFVVEQLSEHIDLTDAEAVEW